MKKGTDSPRTLGKRQKVHHTHKATRWKERVTQTEDIFEAVTTEDFPQINVRQQTIGPVSTEKTKRMTLHPPQKNPTPRNIMFKVQKIKN